MEEKKGLWLTLQWTHLRTYIYLPPGRGQTCYGLQTYLADCLSWNNLEIMLILNQYLTLCCSPSPWFLTDWFVTNFSIKTGISGPCPDSNIHCTLSVIFYTNSVHCKLFTAALHCCTHWTQNIACDQTRKVWTKNRNQEYREITLNEETNPG